METLEHWRCYRITSNTLALAKSKANSTLAALPPQQWQYPNLKTQFSPGPSSKCASHCGLPIDQGDWDKGQPPTLLISILSLFFLAHSLLLLWFERREDLQPWLWLWQWQWQVSPSTFLLDRHNTWTDLSKELFKVFLSPCDSGLWKGNRA